MSRRVVPPANNIASATIIARLGTVQTFRLRIGLGLGIRLRIQKFAHVQNKPPGMNPGSGLIIFCLRVQRVIFQGRCVGRFVL